VTDTESSSIVSILRSDHRSIANALDDERLPTPSEGGHTMREELVAELVRHFVAEEQYLLPAVRAHVPDGDAIADRHFDRDRRIEGQLRQLEEDLDAEQLVALTRQLAASFAAHVSEQETLFADLERSCPATTLAELGDGVLGAEQLAPTRPRYVAPENPAVNKVTSLVEGFIDQVRDYYSGRGT
jgi:hypothetical protein